MGQGSENSMLIDQCESHEVNISGVCVISIPDCINYNTVTKKCKDCTPTYALSSLGYCIPELLLMGGANNQAVSSSSSSNTSSGNINGHSLGTNGNESRKGGEVGTQTEKDCTTGQYLWWGWCVNYGSECTGRN